MADKEDDVISEQEEEEDIVSEDEEEDDDEDESKDKEDIDYDSNIKTNNTLKKNIVKYNTRTQDSLTLFERAAILTARTIQISQTGNSYAKNATSYDTPRTLAEKEIAEGVCPIKATRKIKKNTYELC